MTRLARLIVDKWECWRDGHKYGETDKNGWKSCVYCGYTTRG